MNKRAFDDTTTCLTMFMFAMTRGYLGVPLDMEVCGFNGRQRDAHMQIVIHKAHDAKSHDCKGHDLCDAHHQLTGRKGWFPKGWLWQMFPCTSSKESCAKTALLQNRPCVPSQQCPMVHTDHVSFTKCNCVSMTHC